MCLLVEILCFKKIKDPNKDPKGEYPSRNPHPQDSGAPARWSSVWVLARNALGRSSLGPKGPLNP